MTASAVTRARPWSGRPRARQVALLALVAAGAIGVLLARGWNPSATASRTDPAPSAADMPTSPDIERVYGVRFTNVVLTAGDAIIELRYQVLDEAKAAALHDEATLPYVTVGGSKLATPALGTHGHGTDTAAGRAAYVLLSNTGHAAVGGDEVTVHVGDLALEHAVLH